MNVNKFHELAFPVLMAGLRGPTPCRLDHMSLEVQAELDGESAFSLMDAFDKASASAGTGAEDGEHIRIKVEGCDEASKKEKDKLERAAKVKEKKAAEKASRLGGQPSKLEDDKVSHAAAESDLKKRILDCSAMLLTISGCTYGVTELGPWRALFVIFLIRACLRSSYSLGNVNSTCLSF